MPTVPLFSCQFSVNVPIVHKIMHKMDQDALKAGHDEMRVEVIYWQCGNVF